MSNAFYEIRTTEKAYKFHIGDTLKVANKGRTYAHKGKAAKSSVPSDIVNSLLSSGQLEQTCKWPLEYRVIEIVKKDPKSNGQKLAEIYEEQEDEGLDSIEISQL